ncbi:DUF6894 family protein [Methylobacterium thuringiense]|uniref:DUF6894 domain-containing protein n=1 Tax=Methylobacterium thuringiense TaxID=1003091 RepID=A0ABQ4TPV7_9HYPH|nr:hypothetical protein [Methylobacterium thuringiense]GJE57400.1 hypothetical protein EKPJFOCH_3914 [Methylobacterium thuringiense]
MPRYFFEVHNARAVEWDEAGSECSDRSEIERTARQRLVAFIARHAGKPVPLCLAVLAECGAVVMTAAALSADEMQIFWR